jgi:hypothetical protein
VIERYLKIGLFNHSNFAFIFTQYVYTWISCFGTSLETNSQGPRSTYAQEPVHGSKVTTNAGVIVTLSIIFDWEKERFKAIFASNHICFWDEIWFWYNVWVYYRLVFLLNLSLLLLITFAFGVELDFDIMFEFITS